MSTKIRIVLDTSAIINYCAESIAVGELIAEVADESSKAGIPVLCLAEASRYVTDVDLLLLLTRHPATTLLTVPVVAWKALATSTHEVVGRADAASAGLAAVRHDCEVLTAVPALYAGLDEGGPVISIEE